MKATTVKEVLIAAKWILTNYGWCQINMYLDKDGKYINKEQVEMEGNLSACCALGALYLVDAGVSINSLARDKLRGKIDNHSITDWNDTPGRTKKQVLSLLDQLIEEQQ